MTGPEPTKMLLLTIEAPGVWADDLDETAVEYYDGNRLDYVLDALKVDEAEWHARVERNAQRREENRAAGERMEAQRMAAAEPKESDLGVI